LLGIERGGEIVAAMASAPALHSRWQAYKGEARIARAGKLQVSNVEKLKDSMVFSTGTGEQGFFRTKAHTEIPGCGAKQRRLAGSGNTCWWRKARSKRL